MVWKTNCIRQPKRQLPMQFILQPQHTDNPQNISEGITCMLACSAKTRTSVKGVFTNAFQSCTEDFHALNHLTTDDSVLVMHFGCMLLVGAICFEDSFCTNIGGGGWVSPSWWQHIATVMAGCTRPWWALAGPFLSLLTNRHRKGSSVFVGAPFLAL